MTSCCLKAGVEHQPRALEVLSDLVLNGNGSYAMYRWAVWAYATKVCCSRCLQEMRRLRAAGTQRTLRRRVGVSRLLGLVLQQCPAPEPQSRPPLCPATQYIHCLTQYYNPNPNTLSTHAGGAAGPSGRRDGPGGDDRPRDQAGRRLLRLLHAWALDGQADRQARGYAKATSSWPLIWDTRPKLLRPCRSSRFPASPS